MPNHALKELEMRYAISSSVKAPMQVDSQQKAEDNKKALRKSQQVKLTTIRTEPMLKINPNGLPPIANSAKIRKKTCKNSQNPRGKLEHV